MKTYRFRLVVEPDEGRWIAYCPTLAEKGAAAGGATREEAVRNIQDVLQMVLESLIEMGIPIPDDDECAAVPPEERLVVAV
jgi:predicted RNase H-like HicB family nuclease